MTDYELELLLSEDFKEYLKEDPFDFDLNEEILNEGKILNKIRWKLAMFSLRFLKESYINDFFMAYYSDKDGNPTDKGREFCQKSKKEKIAKMRELANAMKEDDKNKIINSQAAKQCEKSGIISMATSGVIAGLGITANTVGQSHIRSADYNARVNSDVSVWKNDMSISPKGNLIGGSTSLTTQEIVKAIKTNQSGLSVKHQTAFGFQQFGDDLANGKIGTFSGSQLTDPQMYANSGYGVDHISGGVSALASVGSTLLTLAGVASAAMWGSIIIGAVGVGRGIRKLRQANVMRRDEIIELLKNGKTREDLRESVTFSPYKMEVKSMNNISDILEFLKAGRISKQSFEAELAREFSSYANIEVFLDDETTHGQTNATYIAMLVPEVVNGVIKNNLIIDYSALINKLNGEDVCVIIKAAEKAIPYAAKHLKEFLGMYANTEVGYIDCILLYASIYADYVNELAGTAGIRDIINTKALDLSKIHEIELAANSGNESVHKIVEFIQVNKVLPTFALEKAEKLYKSINIPSFAEQNTDKPVENYWYAKIVANITGTFNPEDRKDLDPYYMPEN